MLTIRPTGFQVPRPLMGVVFVGLAMIGCSGDGNGPAGLEDPGSVRVSVTTGGDPLDPDGYTVSVDGGGPQTIGVAGTLTFTDLQEGPHTVALQGMAANCTVQGINPRQVAVTAGQTAKVDFTIACGAVTGSIQVVVRTVGGTDPDGYTLSVDGGPAQAIGVNDSVTIAGLSLGAHTVALGGLAQTCSLEGVNPQSATVIGNRTVRIDFAVACASAFTGRIAFHSARDGDDEIFVMNADGSNVVQLTHNDGLIDRHPNWSPDGTRIVYAADIGANFNTEVVVMNADGSNPVNITNAPLYDGSPDWSPDGSRIVFESNRDDPNGRVFFNDGDPQEIYIINADGTGLTRITTGATIDIHPDFSPTPPRIAFVADLSGLGTEEIFVMNENGSNVVNLTNSPGSDLRPAWSPDGTKILFHSNRDGDFEIYVMNADGTGLTQLTSNSTNDFSPDWSPDGQAVVFAGRGFDGGDDAEILVMNADGTGVTQLTQNRGVEDNGASWTE